MRSLPFDNSAAFNFAPLNTFNQPNSPFVFSSSGRLGENVDYTLPEIGAETEPVKDTNWLACAYYGVLCPTENGDIVGGGIGGGGILSGIADSILLGIKNYLLLAFAMALILLGVYMFARSTPEGKAALRTVA